ncbi:MAG: hypothetical protein V4524_00375 [Patescibacteria group bacterium]
MDKKIYFTGIFFLTICLAAYFLNDYVGVVIHSIINTIAPGRSDSKPTFFFLYGIVLALIYIIFSTKKESKKLARAHIYLPFVLWSGIIGSFGLSLGTYLWFLAKHHLPYTYTLIANNGTFTSTALLHNHFTKGALVFFTQFFSSSSIPNTDSGFALLGLVPQPVFFLQALLALIACVAVVAYYRTKLQYVHSLPLWRNISFSLLYGLSSFMVLKSMLDGGIFDSSAIPGLIFFIVICQQHKRIASISIIFLAGSLIALMGWLYSTGYFTGDQDYVYHVYTICVNGAVLALFYLAFSYKHNRLYVLTTILLALFIFPQIENYVSANEYADQSVSADGAWVSSYERLSDVRFTYLGDVGRLHIYLFTPRTSDDIQVIDLVRASGFSPSYTPAVALYDQCLPHASFIATDLTIHSMVPVENLATATPLYTFMPTPSALSDASLSGAFEYRRTIASPPCLPMTLASYVETVRSLVPEPFFVSDIKNNTNDPLSHTTF